MNINGCRRAPIPVSMVSYWADVGCSWYSSTIAQLGDAPSPGLPISGSKRLKSDGIFMFEALTSMPAA
ncbi:hypothetical protein D3C73_1581320 [compost metagenome]